MDLRKKSVYTTCLRVGISASLLVWLFSKTDLATILETFGELPFSIWLLTVFFFLILCTMAATRWFLLSGILGLSGRWCTYVVYYYIGLFFNLFLPTSVGGDLFKILFVAKGEKGMLVGGCSVITDRLIGLLTMFLTGTVAVLLYPQVVLSGKKEWIFYISGIGFVGLFLCIPLLYRLVRTVRPNFAKELAVLMKVWRFPTVLLKIAILSAALNTILVAIIIVLAKNIGIDLHPSYYFAIFPLTAIITVLPISFNGIGLREGAFVYLLSLQNVPFEKAFTLSLCLFTVQCSASLAGGIVYATGIHKNK
jgi:glycosyltransferase 2 family protein